MIYKTLLQMIFIQLRITQFIKCTWKSHWLYCYHSIWNLDCLVKIVNNLYTKYRNVTIIKSTEKAHLQVSLVLTTLYLHSLSACIMWLNVHLHHHYGYSSFLAIKSCTRYFFLSIRLCMAKDQTTWLSSLLCTYPLVC